MGVLALLDAHRLGVIADSCAALATEVRTGITGPFDPFLHDTAKPHPGQVASAARTRRLLRGSRLARDYAELVREMGALDKGFHVALAMDTLETAVASAADLLDRQFELLNDEKYNMGLGMCCHACTPMTVFSRSTACHNQDKVSMGATAARQVREMVDLTQRAAAE